MAQTVNFLALFLFAKPKSLPYSVKFVKQILLRLAMLLFFALERHTGLSVSCESLCVKTRLLMERLYSKFLPKTSL